MVTHGTVSMPLPLKNNAVVPVRGRLHDHGDLPPVRREIRKSLVDRETRVDRGTARPVKTRMLEKPTTEKIPKFPPIPPGRSSNISAENVVKHRKRKKSDSVTRLHKHGGAAWKLEPSRVERTIDRRLRPSKRNQMTRLSDSLGLLRLSDEVSTRNFCAREASLDIRRIELSPRSGENGAQKKKHRPHGTRFLPEILPKLPAHAKAPAGVSMSKTEKGATRSGAHESPAPGFKDASSNLPMYTDISLTPLEERSLADLSRKPSLTSSEDSLIDWQEELDLFTFSPTPPPVLENSDGRPERSGDAFPTFHVTTFNSSNVTCRPTFSDGSSDSFCDDTYALSPLPPSELSSLSDFP